MSSVQYVFVGGDDGESHVIVFVPGYAPQVAHSSHPNYARIVDGAKAGDASVVALFDISATVAEHFDSLSDRVAVANGRLYFDGDEVNDTLSRHVLRFLDAGVDDWRPLVAFMENVAANPSAHSRDMLYDWLNAADDDGFTITPDGLIVGYKGVARDADGQLVSVNTGRAIVNGEAKTGAIPNPLGAVVEMPRSSVTFDPANGCSRGLHVGTYAYASGWARGALLEVHVNPRDVVSVPTDCGAQKMRTCRYVVVKTIDAPYSEPVVYDYDGDDAYGDEDYDDGWTY